MRKETPMKNKIYIAIICAFSIVFAVSSGFLIKHYYDSAKQAEMYDNLIEVVETEPEETKEPMNCCGEVVSNCHISDSLLFQVSRAFSRF